MGRAWSILILYRKGHRCEKIMGCYSRHFNRSRGDREFGMEGGLAFEKSDTWLRRVVRVTHEPLLEDTKGPYMNRLRPLLHDPFIPVSVISRKVLNTNRAYQDSYPLTTISIFPEDKSYTSPCTIRLSGTNGYPLIASTSFVTASLGS